MPWTRAVIACALLAPVPAAMPPGLPHTGPAAGPQLEVRWHAGQVVLSGELPDEATVALLRDAARRRTGDASQVNDQTVLATAAPPLRHPERVAALLLLGDDGWVLHWSPGMAELHGAAASTPAVANAGAAMQAAFAPDRVQNRLVLRH